MQNLDDETSILFCSRKDCMKIKFTETPESSETIEEVGQASKQHSHTVKEQPHS